MMIRTHFRVFPLLLSLAAWILSGCMPSNPAGDPISAASTNPAPAFTTEIPTNPVPTQTAGTDEKATATPTRSAPFVPLALSAPDCSYGGAFKSIESLDKATVRFVFCQPEPAFLAKIAFPSFGIVPEEWLRETGGGGKGSPLLNQPIGSGPYRFDQWQAGQELRFSAFDDYWGEPKAKTENLIFRWALDDSQRLLELQTGTVQGIDRPNPQDYATIEQDEGLWLVQRSPLSVAYLGMNNTYPPMDDLLVRQAIALGLDRLAILSELFPPGYQVADFFTPCAIPNGCVGEAWYDFDPQKGRELMAQAGYPNGFETQIAYRNVVRGYLPQPALVAEMIRSQLKENLNISARITPIDSPDFEEIVDHGMMPGLFLLGWGADYPDVSNFLDTHFGTRASDLFGIKFNNILSPLNQGSALADDLARRPFYEAANLAIREQIPMIPLVHGVWDTPESLIAAFARTVEGVHAQPFGFERFAEMTSSGQEPLVWMQTYEPFSLYCADESDTDSLRACSQVIEPLYRFSADGVQPQPALAEICTASEDLLVWTCRLRPQVKFHDGSTLDANDVTQSFVAQWDATNELHKGRLGNFAYFKAFWSEFLNAPSR